MTLRDQVKNMMWGAKSLEKMEIKHLEAIRQMILKSDRPRWFGHHSQAWLNAIRLELRYKNTNNKVETILNTLPKAKELLTV